MKCLAVAGFHDVSWHDGSGVRRRVHDSCAGRRADFGGEGGWRGGSVEQLGCPRELAKPHLHHHRHLAYPQNLPGLYARGEGQTEKELPVRDFRDESKKVLPTY